MLIVSRTAPWAGDPGWCKQRKPAEPLHTLGALFLDCGCHVTSYAKLRLPWPPQHDGMHTPWTVTQNDPLSPVFYPNNRKGNEDRCILVYILTGGSQMWPLHSGERGGSYSEEASSCQRKRGVHTQWNIIGTQTRIKSDCLQQPEEEWIPLC